MNLNCPKCARTIETSAADGELVLCPYCGATSEMHDAKALDLTTGEEMPVRFLELVER